jgi:hypothetical protein
MAKQRRDKRNCTRPRPPRRTLSTHPRHVKERGAGGEFTVTTLCTTYVVSLLVTKLTVKKIYEEDRKATVYVT